MKLCVTCRNCNFNEGYHYSDMTYADTSIDCGFHTTWQAPFESREKFLAWNEFAETCQKYEAAK